MIKCFMIGIYCNSISVISYRLKFVITAVLAIDIVWTGYRASGYDESIPTAWSPKAAISHYSIPHDTTHSNRCWKPEMVVPSLSVVPPVTIAPASANFPAREEPFESVPKAAPVPSFYGIPTVNGFLLKRNHSNA
ncbi:hypothetical protein CDAR_232791 [Caerostris darwini]|uniref:Uncharacterized protein n=1 Tax=Caerostris darwini TaxID=1538125 RepID=A0AAV4UPT8_9ARAC|nr:hypothetical protein CDAR_232791 [Caerostris darwini]